VLEWPINQPRADADATFRSLVHGKRVVNGFAGFSLDLLRDLSGLLSTPGSPFPTPEAQAALRRIYPLRYLVVRLADLEPPEQLRWQSLRTAAPPLLRFRGTFGEEDLYELVPLPEEAAEAERRIAFDVIRRHPVLHLTLRPLVRDPRRDQWVEVGLNDRLVGRIPLNGDASAALPLTPPFRHTAPNVLTQRYRYVRPQASRGASYRIGTTGVTSPGDLLVRSVGQPQGSASSIQLDAVEFSPDQRGYNLVAFAPDGRRLAAAAFDTFRDETASHALAGWIAAVPPGAIVAGAVRDEGSRYLTGEAVQALHAVGVARDLRRHFREAHAFIGVKSAPSGSALEGLGPRAIRLTVGQPIAHGRFELRHLALQTQ